MTGKSSGKKGKQRTLRHALENIESIEIDSGFSFGLVPTHPIPSWVGRFYLKIARHKNDEQKATDNNRRTRHTRRGNNAKGNRKRTKTANYADLTQTTNDLDKSII